MILKLFNHNRGSGYFYYLQIADMVCFITFCYKY